MGLPGVELGSSGLGEQEIESVMRALMVEARDRCAGGRQVSGFDQSPLGYLIGA